MKHLFKSFVGVAALAFSVHATTIMQTYSGSLPFTIAGTLPNQNSVLEETFTLTGPSTILISTASYRTGGFQTNLQLYDAAGNFITASMPGGAPDASTGLIGDSLLFSPTLAAGTYIVALTDWLLTQTLGATNLSDGFTFNLGDGTFVDANGNMRTGAYELTVQATPEPATVWIAAPVLALFAIRARKLGRS